MICSSLEYKYLYLLIFLESELSPCGIIPFKWKLKIFIIHCSKIFFLLCLWAFKMFFDTKVTYFWGFGLNVFWENCLSKQLDAGDLLTSSGHVPVQQTNAWLFCQKSTTSPKSLADSAESHGSSPHLLSMLIYRISLQNKNAMYFRGKGSERKLIFKIQVRLQLHNASQAQTSS